MAEPLESAASQRRGDQHLEEGDLRAAMESYRQAVTLDPRNGAALLSLGMVCFQTQAYGEAEQYLRQEAAIAPASAQAHYFLGAALHRQGKPDDAIAPYSRALELQPEADIVYGDLCQALFMSGRRDAAEELVRRAAATRPGLADLYILLGNLYAQANAPDAAVNCYRARLAQDPRHAHALYFLAEALQKRGDAASAAHYYRQALECQPDFAEAWNNLGGIHFNDEGDPQRAIECYQKALALRPDIADIHHNVGLVFKACARFEEAADAYHQALALRPEFAEAHTNLGSLFADQGRLDEAMAHYRKALEIRPDSADACYGMGNALVSAHRDPESVAWFRKTVALNPDHLTARTMLMHVEQQMCRWDDLDAHVRALRQAIATAPPASRYKLLPLPFLAIPGATAAEQKFCAERYCESEFGALAPARAKLAFNHRRTRSDRIRVGYLSADFRQHPVSFLTAEIFELHDRSRFHVTAFSYGPDDGSPMRKRLQNAFDAFVDLRETSYTEAAQRIHADGIDVLVDLTGHTLESRSGILALRPAPVQVNYLGYPGTLGASFVDYMLADRFTVPDAMRQHYTEEIVWLPDCFQANDRHRPRPPPPARRDAGLPDEGFVFCCFNQTLKITPAFFDIWCRLLREVPGSVLWLPASTPEAEGNLHREAVKRGVAPERVVIAPLRQRDDHLARLQCADLFLDTLPFNAGTTCSDALWVGLPVVTCAGDAFASRMAGSLLTAIGAPELVTHDLDAYFRLARDMATRPDQYRAIRDKILANRDTSALFDTPRFVRSLENAIVDMMKRHDDRARAG